MASVIRLLVEHRVGADIVGCCPTWDPDSRWRSARLTAIAVRGSLARSEAEIAHVHLSERGSFLREGSLVALARHRGAAVVVTLHGADFVEFARDHQKLVSAVLRRAHLVTALDTDSLAEARRLAPASICELVPNPVERDDDIEPADTTDELVVFAGEISMRKGADILVGAWRIVSERRPQARCLLVGPSGDYLPPAAERLEVHSAVPPAEMRRILRSARVVALPSRAEAVPMVLTEAMSLGRPFVSTPVGGIAELAAGGELVPVGDALGLADRLTDLLAEPQLACTIGERGRRFCEETRSIDVIDARLRSLYAEATRRRSAH